MTHEEFEVILDAQIQRIRGVLVDKTAEYATADQLNNIRKSAELLGCSMPEAIAGMMVKHTVSLYEMIKTNHHFGEETWDEKITDHIIWLILLKASLVDQNHVKE